MKNKIIFIACDTSNVKEVKNIINRTKTKKLKIIPKFGLQFFYSRDGRKFLKNFNSDLFLDIKASDIGTTISSALYSLKDIKKIKYITVMASVGLKSLKLFNKQAKKINKNLMVLGVTVLTSLDDKSLKEIGYKDKVEKIVLKQAGLLKQAGIKGIVASGREAKIIKKKYKDLFIVTPGIRLPGDKSNDQSRITTPIDAFNEKVSAIVIGRSLTKGNIQKNLEKLISHLNIK